MTASRANQNANITELLTQSDPGNLYVQDYGDFWPTMGVSPGTEFLSAAIMTAPLSCSSTWPEGK
jgi:hypothetical protein